MNRLKKMLGYKEYLLEIQWGDKKEVEIVKVQAWTTIRAIEKLDRMRNIANKAVVKVLAA